MERDEARVHLWQAGDESWSARDDLRERPIDSGGVTETDFGTREFATVDDDGNLIEFFRWVRSPA